MFRRGDIVRCIEGWRGDWDHPRQEVGDLFVVSAAGMHCVWFEGSEASWTASRFELVDEVTEPEATPVAFRVREVFEASADGGKTWVPVPDKGDL